MVSIESVTESLTEAAVSILLLIQEGDNGTGFDNVEKSDELVDAYELVSKALEAVGRAALHD